MERDEKKRTFESESLALPPLQMILVDAKKDQRKRSTKKDDKKFDEETVMRIIDKLIAKD